MFFIFSINNIFLNHSLGIFSVPTLAVFGPVGPEVGTGCREKLEVGARSTEV